MSEIINRVLPIVLLISLGYLLRRKRFISDKGIDDLRKLIVNLALPAVLFLSFLQIELEVKFLFFIVLTFSLCVILYGLGKLLEPHFGADHEYFPFLMTGFEYGMLGISLYGSAYGLDKIGHIAIVDLGHELFIWFVFLALLIKKRDGIQNSRILLTSFLKSPVIIAILSGVLVNLLGVSELLYSLPVSGGVLVTLEYLGNLTVPLILIIVGFGINLDRDYIGEALSVTGLRLVLLLPLAVILSTFLVQRWMGLNEYFQAAIFTLLILPPPFIIPLFMHPEASKEKRYVNNVLTIYTIFTIVLFSLYFLRNPI
ncbi:MAG: AEC family transporter [Anaerolineales bacterium]